MQFSYSRAVNELNFVFFNDPTNKIIVNVVRIKIMIKTKLECRNAGS